MLVCREYRVQPGALGVGEQVRAGLQGPPRPVERVPGPAPVPEGVLLDALPAPVQSLTCQTDDVERIHDRYCGG